MAAPRVTQLTVDDRDLTVSNLDKVLFPASGFTKGQLIDYYVTVAPQMLSHIRDRPLTMKRYPDGVDGKFFFEKHAPTHTPDWLRTIGVPTTQGDDKIDYPVICGRPDLAWAANFGGH